MMFGMFWFGLLVLLLVIGVPVLLVVVVFSGKLGILQQMSSPAPIQQPSRPVNLSTIERSEPPEAVSRYCSHCGAGLQTDWTHCPQCGAPV
jgi:hypothetical protein